MRGLDARLCRLEAIAPVGRTVFAWEPESPEELAELRARLTPGDELVLFRWAEAPNE
jgi:hypothetical protein